MRDPIVGTTSGRIRGTERDGVLRFLGVPYAAAPVGATRFAAPAPRPGWSGVRDAMVPGPTAPQSRRDGFGALDASPLFVVSDPSPDYLAVNVWAPRDESACPVMVFVHGGGFLSGSTRSPLYDGAPFARDGIVFVSVTYRLGLIGFLDLPDAPSNRGLLDVLAALQWVRANAEAFGGDPANVTLFGQSAGATLTTAAMTTAGAGDLLRRVIVQSGNATGAFDPEQAARVTHRAGTLLGSPPTAEMLAARSDDDLVALGAALTGTEVRTPTHIDPLAGLSPFALVLDRQPAEAVAAGVGADVPVLIGTNDDEGHLYLAPHGLLATSTECDVRALAARTSLDPLAAIDRIRARRPGASWGEVRSALLGEALFGDGTRRLVDAHARRAAAPRHEYRFGWRSTALDGTLGAAHTVELPFVFDRLSVPALRGPRGLLCPNEPPDALADAMHGAWVSYARTGDPGWDGLRRFDG